MTVIYNETITTEHIRGRQKQNRNRAIAFILSILGLVVFVVGMNVALPTWLGVLVCIIGGVSLLTLVVCTTHVDGLDDPTPDILYSEKTKNRRVLDVTIERHDHGWHSNVPFVVLRTEDANGLVEKTELCIAKYQESTKHTEETFDVNKGIVYVPYTKGA